MVREVKVEPATEETFRKYGRVIPLRPGGKPSVENETLTAWLHVVKRDPGDGRSVHVLAGKRRPLEFSQMERHTKTDHLFAMVEGRVVAVFAEARSPDDVDELPDPDKIVAFDMTGMAGFTVGRGVWHWATFPVTETATQLIELRTGTSEDDAIVKDLPETVRIVM